MSIARSKGIYWAGQAGSEGDGREHAEVQDGLAEGPSPSKKTAAGHLGAAPAAASAHAPPQQREYWLVPSWGQWVRWEVKDGRWMEGRGWLCGSSVGFSVGLKKWKCFPGGS